ncbi:MAG: DUF4388 domain-containing protein [Myxococcota bacterium]|nr:DUF4388 domain-containing protein [Myxococcota bacterium]
MLRILPGESRVQVRAGDVSPTGLFVELDHEVGAPGELRRLRLGSRDGVRIVELDARVLRVVRSDDLLAGPRIHGVAFEFVLADAEVRRRVDTLVEHLRRGEVVPLHDASPRVRAACSTSEALVPNEVSDSLPDGLCVRLETPWKLRPGERIRLEVPTETGQRVHVDARAVESRVRKNGRFATRFSLERGEDEVGERDVSGIRLALAQRTPELSGDLGSLSLPTVLVLLSMEQLSGVLRLSAEDDVRVYLRHGHVVDVEGAGTSPRAVLARALEWSTGTFSFARRDVNREDRVLASTTALLLDLAREQDENRREVA